MRCHAIEILLKRTIGPDAIERAVRQRAAARSPEEWPALIERRGKHDTAQLLRRRVARRKKP